MYPDFVKMYLYNLSFDHIKIDLLDKGKGAFAFYTLYTDNKDAEGNPRTMAWAMSNASGNKQLAESLLKIADDKNFGFAYVKNDGTIARYKFNCQGVKAVASTLNDLVEDLKKNNIQVDINKLCDPAWMYRSAYY
jgi:hypothetical protein